jgi:hypothetical protein
MTQNSACPSEVSFDDPQLLIPQREDEFYPFRNHPRALALAHLGLMDKAHSSLRCGVYCVHECVDHGDRKREGRSCNQRFCPRCGGRLAQDKIDNHQDKLDTVTALGCKFVLCKVLFVTPLSLTDAEIGQWARDTFSDFEYNWDRYIENLDVHPALLEALSSTGFESINGAEHLACYALLAAEDVDLVFSFRDIWPEACEVRVMKSFSESHDSGEGYFRQMVTIPLMDAERSAQHEVIFADGPHLLQVSQLPKHLSTIEEGQVDMSAGEIPEREPDTSDEREETPPPAKGPFHCDICGKVCRIRFEDPLEKAYGRPTG